MRQITFKKMHGIGNDFVLIDTRNQSFEASVEYIRSIANRHTGIGFDQLLLVKNSTIQGCDAAYSFFNPDGSQAEQCGNGQRCISSYLHSLNPKQTQFCVSGLAGLIHSKIKDGIAVEVNMGRVKSFKTMTLESTICHHADFGNPHLVTTSKNINLCDLDTLSGQFSKYFKDGINFELVEILDKKTINLRVFERGTGETLACGSGACAAVYALQQTGQLNNIVKVMLPGGNLVVEYNPSDENIYLTGPAQHVFSGEISQ